MRRNDALDDVIEDDDEEALVDEEDFDDAVGDEADDEPADEEVDDVSASDEQAEDETDEEDEGADDPDEEHSSDGSWLRFLWARPRDAIGGLVLVVAAAAIVVNALYLQPGPHPAPIFHLQSRPVKSSELTGSVAATPRLRPTEAARTDPPAATRSHTALIVDIQRELERHGFYDGTVDGVYGSKTDAAIRDFEHAAALAPSAEPNEELLRSIAQSPVRAAPGRGNGSADAASKRILALQHALADFGFGPLRFTGVIGPDTRSAIEKFERDRKLPVTGQASDRVVRELSAMTGRPLE